MLLETAIAAATAALLHHACLVIAISCWRHPGAITVPAAACHHCHNWRESGDVELGKYSKARSRLVSLCSYVSGLLSSDDQ
jgi:hypothetical protein